MAELHVLTEYSPFSMGFVIITDKDRAIIIDGGRTLEIHNIEAHVGEREVAAWILTHPHADHIIAFNHMMFKDDHPIAKRTEKIICNFHSYAFHMACNESEASAKYLLEFEQNVDRIRDRLITPVAGDSMEIDGLKIDFLFSKDEKFTENSINDSSLVFRVTGKKKSVLFLGDLGPIGGDALLEAYGSSLKADIVQMAHHGHMCVKEEVYKAINPDACIWCAASWLYQETDREIKPGMFGVARTRKWMADLGVQTHYVTKDGDHVIEI